MVSPILHGRLVLNQSWPAQIYPASNWGGHSPRHDESRAWQSSKKPPHVIAVFTFSFFAKPLRRLVHHVIYRRKTI
jgi:hypothetical protein